MNETPGHSERQLTLASSGDRADLAAYLRRVQRAADAAVVRLRNRADGHLNVWTATGFDVLAVRAVNGRVTPNDTVADAAELLALVTAMKGPAVALGYSLDSAWRGAVPPETGYDHVDEVPAGVLVELAQRGAELAKEHGSSQGPPVSLLDQEVLTVHGGGHRVGLRMREAFALNALGFVPAGAAADEVVAEEVVKVRATASWLRVDARYGSVYTARRRIPLLVR